MMSRWPGTRATRMGHGLLGVFVAVLIGPPGSYGLPDHESERDQMIGDVQARRASRIDAIQEIVAGVDAPVLEGGEQTDGRSTSIWNPSIKYKADLTRDPLMPVFNRPEYEEPIETVLEALPEPLEPQQVSGELTPAAVGLPSIDIQGIIWGGPSPQAVVNGKVYEMGDALGGGRVIAITRDGVIVDFRGVAFQQRIRRGSQGGGWAPVGLPAPKRPHSAGGPVSVKALVPDVPDRMRAETSNGHIAMSGRAGVIEPGSVL